MALYPAMGASLQLKIEVHWRHLELLGKFVAWNHCANLLNI